MLIAIFAFWGVAAADKEGSKANKVECVYPDVENIGNRNINGRIYLLFPNFISYDKEIQIGVQYSAEVEKSTKIMEEGGGAEYMHELVQDLVRHSDARVPFHVKVIDSDEVNAFALPGGFLYVNKGLVEAADTEDELVGVLCHEIAHIAARHASERMTKMQLLEWASIPSIFLGGAVGMAVQNGLGFALDLKILGITRGSEREADILGSQYAWSAGFDPNGFLTFFEKMLAKEKKQPGKFGSWFRTHPPTPDRISYMKESINRCLPPKDQYLVTSSKFDQVKAGFLEFDNALASNRAKGGGKGGSGKPTLKRKSDSEPEADKKPTLKRRTDTEPDTQD